MRGKADPEAVAGRLDACITQWERTHLSELDKLVGESEVEIEVRKRAQRVAAAAPKGIPLSPARLSNDQQLVDGVARHANNIRGAYAKFRLDGKTLAEARKRADKGKKSRPNSRGKNQPPSQDDGQNQGNLKLVEASQQEGEEPAIAALAKAEFVLQCAQAVLNNSLILYGEYRKDQETKRVERQRAAAREEIERLGEQISRKAWTHFTHEAQVFADWINSSKAQVDAAASTAAPYPPPGSGR